MARPLHPCFILCGICALFASLTGAAAGQTSGWRGDGTGKYPAATHSPIAWSRTSTVVKGLRFSARKPAGAADDGTAMPDGVIREWLVAGPFPLANRGAPDQSALPDEA